MPDLSDLQGLRDTVREGGVAALVMNPEQRERFDAMQAFMAVLEGYAEHVMDAVGADAIPDLESLRGSLERRRGERSGFMRVFERLIGMDLKLKQYKLGKQFCDGVVARGGSTASTACGRALRRCRRWPSSRIPPPGCGAPSRPSSTAPPSGCASAPVGKPTAVRLEHGSLLGHAVSATIRIRT